MTKEARNKEKAVEKIRKAITKAVDKGVSAEVVSATVEDALGAIADVDAGDSDTVAPVDAGARKLPGLRKYPSLPGKRGYTAEARAPEVNARPLQPDSEKPSLKKLPGKRKPPTLTLKRANTDAACCSSIEESHEGDGTKQTNRRDHEAGMRTKATAPP